MHDQKHKDSPVFFPLLFHSSSVGSRDEMEVAASKVNGGPPPAPPAAQKLPGFRFFSSSGTSAPSQSAAPTAAAAPICGEAGFPSFNLNWRVGERKKKIANLLRRSEMSKMVESQTDPTFDESQSKETFVLWSEIVKNISPCKMTMEKKMYERKD